jgi:hypothetical protein
MTDVKVIDRAFVEQLGRTIQNLADEQLPGARGLASEASTTMTGAGQAGGLLVTLSFMFAAEYVEGAWEVKRGVAAEFNERLQQIATNWQTVEEGDGSR